MQLSNMSFLIKFTIIHLSFNWVRGEAIQGENVRDANENEFPFAVALSMVKNGTDLVPPTIRVFCSGSLITRKHVLTAEHCMIKKQVDQVEVLVGSINLDLCKAYDPKKFTTYQQWKYKVSDKFPLYYHDVAVITLKFCVTEANAKPAIVPKFEPEDIFGSKVKIAGWGVTKSKVVPKVLRTVDLKIISNVDCINKVSQILESLSELFEWQICASADPWALNSCGDSGGPLLNEQNEIIGITMGTCPSDSIIMGKYSPQKIAINRFLEKRVNMHASLHYYQDFISHFTNKSRHCRLI